ncbi:hypothetical protein D0T56_03745 [Dysgonomonas sp. 520]|nr:hypothetical protein [Dysgonomonas sp. 520]
MLAVLLSLSANLKAQVTIGDGTPPQDFSILEIVSNEKGGLRLPHLTAGQRDALQASTQFQTEIVGKGKGLTIYNTTSNCIEYWNSTKWISLCSDGSGNSNSPALATIGCDKVSPVPSVTEGVEASLTGLSLPYTKTSSDNVALLGNAVLGSQSGLSVLIDGNQTLTAASGNIAIKVVGTATTSGIIYLPITVGGQTCAIAITSSAGSGTPGGFSLDCASVYTNVIWGTSVNIVGRKLPYSGKTGGDISLTDGQILGGPVDGLSILVDGAQTLSAASGNINIKITGTPMNLGTISIPISVGGASCEINVTSATDPSTITRGTGIFTGKACFDIAFSNDKENGCAALTSRESQKTNFILRVPQDPIGNNATLRPYTGVQVYTFKPSGNVSNVRFGYKHTNGESIDYMIPKADYSGAIMSGAECKVTVYYKESLNEDLKGLTTLNAYTVEIYAVYNDSPDGTGMDKSVKLTARLQDCACCGAQTVDGGWLAFRCHNLGVDETLDPFTHSDALYGSFYQWGLKKSGYTVGGGATSVTAWGDGSWDENQTKGPNDPCPTGWKVPSIKQWASILGCETPNKGEVNKSFSVAPEDVIVNTWKWTGKGYLVNETLYLPAAGHLVANISGTLQLQGEGLSYWGSDAVWNNTAYTSYASQFGAGESSLGVSTGGMGFSSGYTVRCVEDN